MKRRVWVDRILFKIFPNIFTILVGRPGIGKGAAMNPLLSLMGEAGVVNVISDRTTIEEMMEELAKGFMGPQSTAAGKITINRDSSAYIFSPELSIFITASAITLPVLADLWDSREGQPFRYKTKSGGKYEIKEPCISLLGGSTTEWLISSIPNSAVGGGFTRRVNFIYSNNKGRKIPWPKAADSKRTRTDLIDDLKYIQANLRGEFKFDNAALPLFEKIYHLDPNEFDSEALAGYKTSAWVHATKMAICLSVARSDDRIITKDDMEFSISKVEQVIKDIPRVFRAIGDSDMVASADRVLRFLEAAGYATRNQMMKALWQHVSMDDLDRILVTLEVGGLIVCSQQGPAQRWVYKAIPATPQGGKGP